MKLSVLLNAILLCTPWCVSSQSPYGNCPALTIMDLGTVEESSMGLIAQILRANVSISEMEILCMSSGTLRDRYSSATALTTYVDFTAGDQFPNRRFVLICDRNNTWAPHPDGAGPLGGSGEPSMMCAACSVIAPVSSSGSSYNPATFCVSCNPSCNGTGLCYLNSLNTSSQSQCCTYYYGSNCVERCPENTYTNTSSNECVPIPTPMVPPIRLLNVGERLLLDCGDPSVFSIFLNNEELSPFGMVDISVQSLDDAGVYSCVVDDMEISETLVVVRPGNLGPIVVTTGNLSQVLSNDSVVNEFDNLQQEVNCFAGENYTDLQWTSEGENARDVMLKSELRTLAGQVGNHTFFIDGVRYTLINRFGRVNHLTLIVSRAPDLDHYLVCHSPQSNERQHVTVTTRRNFADTRNLNTTPLLGQRLVLTFRVLVESIVMPVFTQNETILMLMPSSVCDMCMMFIINRVTSATAGSYSLSLVDIDFIPRFTLAFAIIPIVPTLSYFGPSPLVVREGDTVMITCTPSEPSATLEWTIPLPIEDGGGIGLVPITNVYRNGVVNYTDATQQSLILSNIPSISNIPGQPNRVDLRCSVSGTEIFQQVQLQVRRRCPASLAAGLLWNTSFDGDIRSYRCNSIDPRFSNTVQVSRRCGPGMWSRVDFSNCTLTSTATPFILLWLPINSTSFTTSNSRLFFEFRSIIQMGTSNQVQVETSMENLKVVSFAAANAGLPSLSVASPGQIVYSSSLILQTNDSSSINVEQLRGEIAFFTSIGDVIFLRQMSSDRDVALIIPSSECDCRPYIYSNDPSSGEPSEGMTPFERPLDLCIGGSNSPCACSVEGTNMSMVAPDPVDGVRILPMAVSLFIGECRVCNNFYAGNGTRCVADTDGDGYPATPLSSCSSMNLTDGLPIYCSRDTCATIYNIPQSDVGPCTPSTDASSNRCVMEQDATFGLQWGYTTADTTVNQPCGTNFVGNATRVCYPNGSWADPNVSGCMGVAFEQAALIAIELTVDILNGSDVSVERVVSIVDSLTTLVDATTPSPEGRSAFPMDLQVTASYLNAVVNYYNAALDEGLSEVALATVVDTESIINIISNVISTENLPGAAQLSEADREETFAQDILDTAENYGLFLAQYLDQIVDLGGSSTMLLAANNVLLNPSVVDVNEQLEDVVFPASMTTINNVSAAVLDRLEDASISVPTSFIQSRAAENGVNRVRLANVLFQNLEMFLSLNVQEADRDPVALVLSTQVQQRTGNVNAVLANPINLTFTAFNRSASDSFTCVFWDFSLRNGLGGWSSTGVSVVQVTDTAPNVTTIECRSNHLTSFSVLVNVAGVKSDNTALNIVSYIGISLSLVCLLATILFFLSFGKALFSSVHNFVHLNLAIALFLAYLTFAVGIEVAARNKIACHAIAALLQYLFLSVFCWMLCEGVMLYLMLVVVFSTLSKKWWFFLLLGWLPPIVFVVIGLSVDFEQYGVTDSNEVLQFCWLASGGSQYAIWFFAGPMIAIIIINMVFLILVLGSLVRSKITKSDMTTDNNKRVDIVKDTVKAAVILLPLLGVTWVIGLFAVSQNTLVFAWIFAILNTLQGVFVFIFHVLRNEKIWGRFKRKYHLFESTSKSGPPSSSGKGYKYYKPKSGTTSSGLADSSKYSETDKIQLEDYRSADPSPVFNHSAKQRDSIERILQEQNLLQGDERGSSSSTDFSIDHKEPESLPVESVTSTAAESSKMSSPILTVLPTTNNQISNRTQSIAEETPTKEGNNDLLFDEDSKEYPDIKLRLTLKGRSQNIHQLEGKDNVDEVEAKVETMSFSDKGLETNNGETSMDYTSVL